MTPKQDQLFEAQIRLHVKGCPACGTQHLTHGSISVLLPYKDGNAVIGGQMTPVVASTCMTCGYVLCFSAVRLGLLTQEGKDVE